MIYNLQKLQYYDNFMGYTNHCTKYKETVDIICIKITNRDFIYILNFFHHFHLKWREKIFKTVK